MNELIYSYLAGVVDSDGYIGVSVKRGGKWQDSYQPRVQVKQVQPDAVDLFASTFGGLRYGHKPGSTNGRPLQVWSVHSAAVVPVLEALLPHLRIKPEQARNALALAAINSEPKVRFDVPEIVDGEPMIPLTEVAARSGRSYESVIQAVHNGTMPHVKGKRVGRGPSVFVPASFVDVWMSRAGSPPRPTERTERLEALYLRAKQLNRVGV